MLTMPDNNGIKIMPFELECNIELTSPTPLLSLFYNGTLLTRLRGLST